MRKNLVALGRCAGHSGKGLGSVLKRQRARQDEILRNKATKMLIRHMLGYEYRQNEVFMTSNFPRQTSSLRRQVLLTLAALMLTALPGLSQEETTRRPDRQVPTKPFKIIGNIYYVGQTDNSLPGSDDASYLITTPQGHILLDTGEERTVPQIKANIQKLGLKYEDIKYLIHSHSHSDHVAGDALLKQEVPGVQLIAMAGDAEVIASGGEADFDEERPNFKPAKVDRIIKDGDKVELGGVTLTAHRTAGHTEGCTTWTTTVQDAGKTYSVIFVCSARISAGMQLANNPRYPNIAKDYAATYRLLKEIKPDVFLASHAFFHNMVDKAKKLEQGATTNPFIDPAGYRTYIEEAEKAFLAEFQKQGGKL
jgi:metallo-beta-lactamase class B